MFHVELRQFPHNYCRFNLGEEELRATIVDRWVKGEWIELGGRKWSPAQATLTVLEGEHISPDRLTMGRGWRAAERSSRNVTERILDQAAQERPSDQAQPPRLHADSLALEILADIAARQAPLRRAWELAAARDLQPAPSESLALAEAAVASLLASGLIKLQEGEAGQVDPPRVIEDRQDQQALVRCPASWMAAEGTRPLWIVRA